jgi:uncharacterized protein YceK
MKSIYILFCVIFLVLTGCASIMSTITDGGPNRQKLITASDVAIYESTICIRSAKMIPTIGVPDGDFTKVIVHRGDGAFRPNYICLSGRPEFSPLRWSGGRLNPWIIGNIIYGGVFGILVDGLTGAMWEPNIVWTPR